MEQDAAMVINQETATLEDNSGLQPIFANEVVSESELMGEASPEPVTKQNAAPAEGNAKADDPAPAEGNAKADDPAPAEAPESENVEAKASASDDGKVKPPPGYVPHQALAEERRMRQEQARVNELLARKIQELENARQQQAQSQDGEQKKPPADTFKLLSKKEFADLRSEDPEAAMDYQHELTQRMLTYQAQKDRAAQETQRQSMLQSIMQRASERVQKNVPELQAEGVGEQLREVALQSGFHPAYLEAMTSPGTMIIPPGEKKPYMLGDGAAALVELLYKHHTLGQTSNPEVLKGKLSKEIEARVRKEVTTELMNKFKSDPTGSFVDLSALPGASSSPEKKFYSEADFRKMSAADQEKVLMGAM